MKRKKLSTKDLILIAVLAVVLVALGYYLFFYTPIQNEVADISIKTEETENEITIAQAKQASKISIKKELEEIFSRPSEEITEIAPFDNAKVVMSELNAILSQSQSYKLTFDNPAIEESGTVRRTVKMNFTCSNFASAKKVVGDLCGSRWRCLMKDLTVDGGNDVNSNVVSCSATIVFFESTKLAK